MPDSGNLTPSSTSSISIPYPALRKPEFRMCPYHVGFPLNFFCQQCNTPICSDCSHTSHRNHKTIPLMQKSKELTESLRSVLIACHRQEKEIERRSSVLNICSRDIEDTTAMAIQQMDEQCRQINIEMSRVYNSQIEMINKLKREEQSKFMAENEQLQNLNKHRRDVEETGRKLLEQTASPDFITRSSTFLSYNQLKELPENRQRIWKRILYRDPSYKYALDSEQFRKYVEQHILGYFAPDRPGQLLSDNDDLSISPFKRHGSFTGSIQSLYSVGASSHATALSANSRLSHISTVSGFPTVDGQKEFPDKSLQPIRKTAELLSYVNLEKFEGSHLKIFSSAFFSNESMWICGWNKNLIGNNDTVLMNVEIPDYTTIMKQKKGDPKAELPTIMIRFRDVILFAKKGGKEIYSFNPKSKKFKRVFGTSDLTIAAMCSSNERVFILNPKQADYIRVLDSRFQAEGKIPTGLGDVRGCEIDICLIGDHQHSAPSTPSSSQSRVSSPVDYNQFGFQSPAEFNRSSSFRDKHTIDNTIVICTSNPHASLRAVSQMEGVVWQIDSRTNPELGSEFNPCSVSASETGDIYFADSSTDKASFPIIPSLIFE